MSLNVVHLIGLVAATPRTDAGSGEVTLLVVTGDDRYRERHRVVADGDLSVAAQSLRVGQPVVVLGTLRRDHRSRVIALARDLWPTADAPPSPNEEAPTSTHASPREHERSGHWRRLAIGSPRERLVWVRATRVGSTPHGPTDP